MKTRKVRFFTGLLLAMTALLIACNNGENPEAEDKAKSNAIPVKVEQVEKGDIAAVFSGTANLEAEEEATVVAKVSGVVRKIYVEEGMEVTRGQVLAKLDDEQLALRHNQARANLNKSRNEFIRSEELFGKKLISEDAFDKVKYEYEASKASFDLSKLELDYSEIRAPINGVISERFIKVGNMININQETFRITDFDPLNALLFVPERNMNKLSAGQNVRMQVDALPGETFTGKISRISPVVDPNSGTFKVTVEVKADRRRLLKPGMFGRVNIIYDVHEQALLVPKEAVLTEDREQAVFVVRDSMVERITVSCGYGNATHLEITAGLAMGDTVVTVGQASLKDSSVIKIINDTVASL
jgi:membrane fusion protein (multidrug efflux system)